MPDLLVAKDLEVMAGVAMDDKLSRREFVALSVAAGIGASQPIVETDVEIKTADGTCDAVFFHPAQGSHPGVLVWHDSGGVRPSFREIGRRLAGEGYAVLVPNLFYRMARTPVFPTPFDPPKNPADMELYRRVVGPFLAPGAAERDAVAYVAFLDAQREVSKKRKIGTQGYCLGGPYVLKTAAAFPRRVGAGASFHGGFLVTDNPDSPHLLAPKIKAPLYFAISSDDDEREPQVKDKLKEAFAGAKVRAEIEVFPNARHGFTVPDSRSATNTADADRAWLKLLTLYKREL
jgi:carboxymethylenebutenolidase